MFCYKCCLYQVCGCSKFSNANKQIIFIEPCTLKFHTAPISHGFSTYRSSDSQHTIFGDQKTSFFFTCRKADKIWSILYKHIWSSSQVLCRYFFRQKQLCIFFHKIISFCRGISCNLEVEIRLCNQIIFYILLHLIVHLSKSSIGKSIPRY